MDRAVFFAITDDGFGKIGIDVGVGYQLFVGGCVDVDFSDGSRGEGEVFFAKIEVNIL